MNTLGRAFECIKMKYILMSLVSYHPFNEIFLVQQHVGISDLQVIHTHIQDFRGVTFS